MTLKDKSAMIDNLCLLLLPLHNIRLQQGINDSPALVNVIQGPCSCQYDLPREKHQGHDPQIRVSEDESREDVGLVCRIDMIPFVKGLYVQDLAVANFQLAVTDYILYLEASDGESLPCAHLSQHGSDVVRGEQRLGCRFRAGDDEFATGEQKDRAVRAHKAQGDGRKLFSIE